MPLTFLRNPFSSHESARIDAFRNEGLSSVAIIPILRIPQNTRNKITRLFRCSKCVPSVYIHTLLSMGQQLLFRNNPSFPIHRATLLPRSSVGWEPLYAQVCGCVLWYVVCILQESCQDAKEEIKKHPSNYTSTYAFIQTKKREGPFGPSPDSLLTPRRPRRERPPPQPRPRRSPPPKRVSGRR